MKVEIIQEDNCFDLKKAINEFIKNKNVIGIKYSTTSHGYHIYNSALIMYKENNDE